MPLRNDAPLPNHLYYFWMVAREGGVVRASEELMVSQPTISNQLRELETAIGQKLFERAGRGLRLTEAGRVAFNYANEIYSLVQEMLNALEHRSAGPVLRLPVGLLDVIPKPVAHQLLMPARKLAEPLRLICREDKADRLLADLAAHRTELVLSDSPVGTAIQVVGYNHLLGESGVSFFATRELAERYKRGFPKSLNSAPMLVPSDHTEVRRSLNIWFDAKRVHPMVAGEFDDSALMFWFGRTGAGVFPAPTLIEEALRREMDPPGGRQGSRRARALLRHHARGKPYQSGSGSSLQTETSGKLTSARPRSPCDSTFGFLDKEAVIASYVSGFSARSNAPGRFAKKGKSTGSADRIALPVAADRERDRKLGMALVEDTGFDASTQAAPCGYPRVTLTKIRQLQERKR